MSKNQSTASTAERKQTLEACIHKLKEIELTVKKLYPRVGTEIPSTSFSRHEQVASEYLDYSADASGRLAAMWEIETRKEVTNV